MGRKGGAHRHRRGDGVGDDYDKIEHKAYLKKNVAVAKSAQSKLCCWHKVELEVYHKADLYVTGRDEPTW